MSPVGSCEPGRTAEIRKGALGGFTFIRNIATSVKAVGCLHVVSFSRIKQQLSKMTGAHVQYVLYSN